jgi:hypothetical protein
MELDTTEFKERFREMHVKDDGNCLFATISHFIFRNPTRHLEIRKKVCDFYKDFDFDKDFEKNSVEYKLQKMGAGFDRADNDNDMSEIYDFNRTSHATNMCKPGVWGNMSDLYAICIIYKINIIVCELIEGKKMVLFGDKYRLTACNPGVDPTFYVLLKNKKHFSPLIDSSVSQKSSLRRSSKTRSVIRKAKSIVRKTAKYAEIKKQKKMEAQLQKYIDSTRKNHDINSLEISDKQKLLKRDLPSETKS